MKLCSLIYLISSYWCCKMTEKFIRIWHKEGKWLDIIESSIASQFTEFVFSAKVWNYRAVEAHACRAKAPARTFGVFAHKPRLQASSSLPPKIRGCFIWDAPFFITRISISLQNSWLARCSVRWTQTGEKMLGYSWWPGRRFCWHVWLSRPSRESGILFWITYLNSENCHIVCIYFLTTCKSSDSLAASLFFNTRLRAKVLSWKKIYSHSKKTHFTWKIVEWGLLEIFNGLFPLKLSPAVSNWDREQFYLALFLL